MSRRRSPRAAHACLCAKVGLPTQEAAQVELARCRRRAAAGDWWRRECRVYPCPTTTLWHLTSRPEYNPLPQKEGRAAS